MKKIATSAIAALSIAAFAVTPAFAISCTGTSFKADKITSAPDLIRSNVPTCDGRFVSGFQVIGNGGITWYADAHHADECFDMDVTFLPDGISAYDMDDIRSYFGDDFDFDVWQRVEVITCV